MSDINRIQKMDRLNRSYCTCRKMHAHILDIEIMTITGQTVCILCPLCHYLVGSGYTDAFSNRSVFRSLRFLINPLWITYSNVSVFLIVFIVSM